MYSTENPSLVWKQKQGHCPQKPEDNRPQDVHVYIKGSFQFESQHLTSFLLYLILFINCDINISNGVFSPRTSICLLDTDNTDRY